MYQPPLETYWDYGQSIGLNSAIETSLASMGAAALSVNSMIDQMQQSIVRAQDIQSLFSSLDVGSFIAPLPDLSPIAALLDQ